MEEENKKEIQHSVEDNTSQDSSPEEPLKNENTAMAVVAYILFFVPLLTDAKKDEFVKYHVKQGLMLFIAWIVVAVLTPALFMVIWLLYLGLLVLFIIGIMNALNGKKAPLPLIGQFAEKFNI
ncbi:MAG: hypothetical protein ABH832_01565 [bacterium]